LDELAAVLRAFAARWADSGPDGAWPGGPHPAWTAAALSFTAAKRAHTPPRQILDSLPDAFWLACGFGARPDANTAAAGLTGAVNALVGHPAVPPRLAQLHALLIDRGAELERLARRGTRPRRAA
jgi:hypothetical protein